MGDLGDSCSVGNQDFPRCPFLLTESDFWWWEWHSTALPLQCRADSNWRNPRGWSLAATRPLWTHLNAVRAWGFLTQAARAQKAPSPEDQGLSPKWKSCMFDLPLPCARPGDCWRGTGPPAPGGWVGKSPRCAIGGVKVGEWV